MLWPDSLLARLNNNFWPLFCVFFLPLLCALALRPPWSRLLLFSFPHSFHFGLNTCVVCCCCCWLHLLVRVIPRIVVVFFTNLLCVWPTNFSLFPFVMLPFFGLLLLFCFIFHSQKLLLRHNYLIFFSLTHFCTLSLICCFFQHFFFIYALCCVISFGSFDFLIYNFVCAARSYSSASTHRFFSALARKRVFAGRRHSSVCFSVCMCVCVYDQLAVWLTRHFQARSVRYIWPTTMNIFSDLLPYFFHTLSSNWKPRCVCVGAFIK